MKKGVTNRIVLSGMLIAVGLLLPFITAHAFGMQGTILLPMHLPVFLMGFLCGPQYGAIGGIVIPVLSCVLTGMPPAFPMLPVMVGELCTYGLISGLLYKKIKLPLFPSLLLAMVCGRIVYGLIFAALMTANNGSMKVISVIGSMAQGIPGIIIQMVLIPVIVTAVNKYFHQESNKKLKPKEEVLNKAVQMIKEEKASCVIIKKNEIIYSAYGHGVAPLIALYENEPEVLKDAFIVDKVIGKAAAMIAVLGGASKVYGLLMSTAAESYLKEYNIRAEYGRCVEIISNRTGDGLCPLEKTVLNVDDAETAYRLLKDTISRLSRVV
jgi:hypothetical protein